MAICYKFSVFQKVFVLVDFEVRKVKNHALIEPVLAF